MQFDTGFSAYFQGFDDVDYDLLDMKVYQSGLLKMRAGGAHIRERRLYQGYSMKNMIILTQCGLVQGQSLVFENFMNYWDQLETLIL